MVVENRNPWTGEVHRYSMMSDAEIDRRLVAAEKAFPVWAALSLEERGAHLRKVGALLRERKQDLARLVTAEMGKLHREAVLEVEKCAGACDYYADEAHRYLREEEIATEAARSYVRYEPIGCVLAIMPWNFPIWQVFRFLAPTLMAGNVAVLKHAINVPRCADAIGALLREAGVPEGVFGVLHMDNGQAAAVIADPRIRAVTLTGSERAGRSVAATAGQHLKKCVLELGGSDPFVVLDDADLDRAVKVAVASRYGNAGQTCIAAKRFILVSGVVERFTERFLAEAAQLQPGDPEAPGTNLAPMARADLRDGLHRQVSASLAKGAKLLLGGEPGKKDTVYPATVLAGIAPGMPAWDEELFGPVASLIRVRDEAEALQVANATSFGLGASVWTTDLERGEAFARGFVAGACFVNAQVRSDVRLPFGGTRNSGFGRELAGHGIHEFTNIKTMYVA